MPNLGVSQSVDSQRNAMTRMATTLTWLRVFRLMPAIVPWEVAPFWLETDQEIEKLQELLQPLPGELMAMHRVTTEVNSSRAQGHQLIQPVTSTGLPFVN